MISYDRFWKTMKEKEISTYTLINKHGISPSTIQKLRKTEYVSLRTLDDLCQIMGCELEDLVEVFPDNINVKK